MPRKHNRALITGFDAFEKFRTNPSELLVGSLPESLSRRGSKERIEVDTLVLPTCCDNAWKKLRKKLEGPDGPYSLLVMTGLANKRNKLSLERFALNIRDYRVKDNGGHQYDDEKIDKRGPDALRTSVELLDLKKELLKKGFPCDISNHAGTFLCNEVYYRALLYQEHNDGPEVLFVHIPQPRTYLRTLGDKKSGIKPIPTNGVDPIDHMAKAIKATALFMLQSNQR